MTGYRNSSQLALYFYGISPESRLFDLLFAANEHLRNWKYFLEYRSFYYIILCNMKPTHCKSHSDNIDGLVIITNPCSFIQFIILTIYHGS